MFSTQVHCVEAPAWPRVEPGAPTTGREDRIRGVARTPRGESTTGDFAAERSYRRSGNTSVNTKEK